MPQLGNRSYAACIKLSCPDFLLVLIVVLSLALPLCLIELCLGLRLKVQTSLPLAAVKRGREREMHRQRFPSALPSPLCSPTLSTQMILAADGGSTAPLQWDGGGGNSFLFTNLWSSPGNAAVRWDLSRGS